MSKNPQIFHGEWWVPAVADRDTSMTFLQPEGMMGHERKYTGTLTYDGDEDSTLELYHVPSNFHSKHYCQNEVMWGKDANGNIFTLFNVMIIDKTIPPDFTNTTFKVGLILIGEHVLSTNEAWSKKCVVHFPYLNNWMFNETQHFVTAHFSENSFQLNAAFNERKLSDLTIDYETYLSLFHRNEM